MKKTLLILLAGILAVAFSACKNEKEETLKQLQAEVESINAECPMQVDEITTWKSFGIEDGTIVYSYTVMDVEGVDVIKLLKENAAEQKKNLENNLKQTDEFMTDSKPLVVKAGLGIKYVYTSSSTGDKAEMIFTPEEVAAL